MVYNGVMANVQVIENDGSGEVVTKRLPVKFYKTPRMKKTAVSTPIFSVPKPIPAKIATNERMVIGLVRVSAKMERYAAAVPWLSFSVVAADASAFASKVLMPK